MTYSSVPGTTDLPQQSVRYQTAACLLDVRQRHPFPAHRERAGVQMVSIGRRNGLERARQRHPIRSAISQIIAKYAIVWALLLMGRIRTE